MSVPENHVVAEGRNLRAAVEAAAGQLGVPTTAVEHKLDFAHMRASGSAGVDSVRIFAWARDVAALAPALAAEEWVRGLLAAMGREGTVRSELRGDSAVVYIDVKEGAGHLVGRQGTTLRAIQHLLERNVASEFPGVNFRLDVSRPDDGGGRDGGPRRDDRRDDRRGDDRGPRRDDRRDDRGPRSFDRGDRGPRRDDRPRDDRPRDDRPRDDRPRDDRPREDRGPRSFDRGDRDDRGPRRQDPEELKRLSRKLALKVRDTGSPETIRRELNSFDRRLVHLEVAEVGGVASRSIGEGADRRVEIYVPEEGGEG